MSIRRRGRAPQVNNHAASILWSLVAATSQLRRCRTKGQLQKLFSLRSEERARRHRQWLAQHEGTFLKAIACGEEVDPSRVKPALEVVTSQEQRVLFRFARFTSSLPFTERVGRRLKFLIRDISLPNRPLMGIAALGSPVLDLSQRDHWVFGCNSVPRHVRHRRLGIISELYVAVGLQPYTELLAGKLICYCMASRDVVETYNRRYARKPTSMPLTVIYTLSAYGPRSSQFNRLTFQGRRLYRVVGVTGGWSVSHIPEGLVERIRDFLESKKVILRNALPRKYPSKFHLVHRFLRHVGVPPELVFYTGIHRAIYACPLARNFQDVAQRLAEPEYDIPPLEEAVQWWRLRWLRMRSSNPEVMHRVGLFRPERTYSARAICKRNLTAARVVPEHTPW
jgi:hypothetical protein